MQRYRGAQLPTDYLYKFDEWIPILGSPKVQR